MIVQDTTGNPVWLLQMAVSPFQLLDKQGHPVSGKTIDNIMKYKTQTGEMMNIDSSPQTIAKYGDFNTPITANVSTTNFDNEWWQNVNGTQVQRSGPMLFDNDHTTPFGKYTATVTWTVQNSVN